MLATTILTITLLAQTSLPSISDQDKTKAKALLTEGTALYKKGDYAGALEKFQAAYAAYPSAKLWFNIGQANRDLGRPVEALHALKTYLLLVADAPADTKVDALTTVAELQTRLGQVRIECETAGAEISLDGKVVGVVPLPEPIWATPGRHQVTAVHASSVPALQYVEVSQGDTQIVAIRLQPTPLLQTQMEPPPTADQEASEHLRKASLLFETRDFMGAVTEFEAAYAARSDPAILFKIGESYRLSGRPDSALGPYRRYLDHLPTAGNRTEVEAIIAQIERGISDRRRPQVFPGPAAAPTPVARTHPSHALATHNPPQPVPSASKGWSLFVGGVALSVVGIVGIAAGGYFTHKSRSIESDLSTAERFSASKDDEGRQYHKLQYVAYGSGGLALTAGLLMCVLGNSHPQVSLGPVIFPHYAGGSVSTRF